MKPKTAHDERYIGSEVPFPGPQGNKQGTWRLSMGCVGTGKYMHINICMQAYA